MDNARDNVGDLIQNWCAEQARISSGVIPTDANSWSHFFSNSLFEADRDLTIGGADISFSTSPTDRAIGTIAIAKLRTSGCVDLVYSRSREVTVRLPYISGFLGFREAPIVSELLQELPENVRSGLDCLLLDGNGILHPRKAGLACQVGVSEDIATIGVSKALLCVDGLSEHATRELAVNGDETGVDVIGKSGTIWARALMTGNAQRKPIYVSIGHKVSLSTASNLVRRLCEFRVPSPIREADLHSRAYLRGEEIFVYKAEEFLYTRYLGMNPKMRGQGS